MSAFITMNLPTLAEKGVWIILRVFFSLAKTYLLHSLLCIYEPLCFFDISMDRISIPVRFCCVILPMSTIPGGSDSNLA
jgi:hypothetical protein